MAKKLEKTNAPGPVQPKGKAINGFRVRFIVPNALMKDILAIAFDCNIACGYKNLVKSEGKQQVKISGACTEVYVMVKKVYSMFQDILETQEFLTSYKCTGIHIESMPDIPFAELSQPD